MPKVPKIRSLHIFAISPKNPGGEVDFLPADKHRCLLEEIINFGVPNQASPKYPKQVYNIFVISPGKREG